MAAADRSSALDRGVHVAALWDDSMMESRLTGKTRDKPGELLYFDSTSRSSLRYAFSRRLGELLNKEGAGRGNAHEVSNRDLSV